MHMLTKRSKIRTLSLVLLLIICTISMVAFSACGNENPATNQNNNNSTPDSNDSGTTPSATLTFTTLKVTGNTVSAVVPNSQDKFDFKNEITVGGGMTFAVCKDEFGTDKILTKVLPLEEGDNTVYVLGICNDEVMHTYTVTIHRNAMCKVTFYNGNAVFYKKTVEEGALVEQPTAKPSKSGFDFVEWDYDFTQPITKDTAINAVWAGGSNSVVLENNGGTGDSLTSYTTGEGATLPILTKTGCEFAGWYTSPDFTGEKVEAIGKTEIGFKHFYAKWRAVLTYEDINYSEVAVSGLKNEDVHEIFVPGTYNGKKVVKIKDEIFHKGFTGLPSVLYINISQGVRFIGAYAFPFFKNVKEITLPESLVSIGAHAFEGCESITSITVPTNVTKIENSTFARCTSLKTVVLSDKVTHIGTSAFSGCDVLENVNVPKELKDIDTFAFADTDIKGYEIPHGMTTIKRGTFEGCYKLEYIVIPTTVTKVEESAFNFDNRGTGRPSLNILYKRASGTIRDYATISPNYNVGIGWSMDYNFSEKEPTINSQGTGYTKRMWHYVDGKPTIWVFGQ